MNIQKKIQEMFLIAMAKSFSKKFLKEDKGMIDKKEWYKSKTVWSGIITIGITIYNASRPLVEQYFNVKLPEIPDVVYTVLGAVGIYGRVTANKKIG